MSIESNAIGLSDDPANNQNHSKLTAQFRSALSLLLMTAVFGVISYGVIYAINTVWQAALPMSLWCVLAMVLAIGYYFVSQARASKKHHLQQH